MIPSSGRGFEEKGKDLEKSPRRMKGDALSAEGKAAQQHWGPVARASVALPLRLSAPPDLPHLLLFHKTI